MFRPVAVKPNFAAQEEEVLRFWQSERIFDLLREKNEAGPRFSFIDGPITANNPMGVHHAWGRTYKDLFQRYKSMLGYHLRYQNGFDCQGLWVEVEVEREMGFNSKRQIEAYGLESFSLKCRERVIHYADLITEQSKRLGQWMDWQDSYYTMTDNNIEHIWHFLRRCHDRGWLYRGHRTMPWCIRCGTSLSQHELVGTDTYINLTHTAVYLELPVLDRNQERFLVWTTTPWTLSANVALAVHPELEYAYVRWQGKVYILSRPLVDKLLPKGDLVKTVPGKELVGLRYQGPFDTFTAQQGVEHQVIPWTEVGEEEGTGIVHIAPGCGAEDFELSKLHNLPVLVPINDDGDYVSGFGFLNGMNVRQANPQILQDLQQKNLLFKTEEYTHRYPVCWRCGEELVFKVVDEWFIATDQVRPALIREAAKVRWMPESAGKRMEDWLQNMGDWCISRKRFWGLPLPIYLCSCGKVTVLGSRHELEERAVPTPVRIPELHRPWIDEVRIRCPHCGEMVERIPEVGDAWLDAGIVPYSTLHYLYNPQYWRTWFPAEFITEMREQIRLWFYSMLFMSVTLEDRTPYQSALVYEKLMDVDGRPMHRSLGNAIWFDEAVGRMGADAMRWLFASQNTETNLLFGYGPAEEVTRKLLVLWNVYSFFVTYANIDHFDPTKHASSTASRPFLDRWILARLNSLVIIARDRFDHYDAATVTRECERFIEDLSNWWLRCNRRRFWKTEEDSEKVSAYLTLYEVLVTFIRLVAPIIPFLAEQIYQNLVCSAESDAPRSVHLSSYPEPLPTNLKNSLEPKMTLIQRVIGLGRAARNKAGIKVRQPITKMILVGFTPVEQEAIQELSDIIKDELNLKGLAFEQTARGLQEILLLPNLPILGPRFGKRLPAIRTALMGLSGEQALLLLQDQQPLSVLVEGEEVLLQPEEILVQRLDQPGFAAEAEGHILVVLDTYITPELRREGLARDLAHAIQNLRKEAGFKVEDRIRTYFRTSPELTEVLREYSLYLKKETLSEELSAMNDSERTTQQVEIDGIPVHFVLEKIV